MKWVNIVPNPIQRNDSWGKGHYGASRGNRSHKGEDLEVYKGQDLMAPIDGYIVKVGQVYSSDTKYKTIWIMGTGDFVGYLVKIFYATLRPGLIGQNVVQGQIIANAQAISEKYSSSMLDHIHVEIRRKQGETDPYELNNIPTRDPAIFLYDHRGGHGFNGPILLLLALLGYAIF